MRKAVGKKYMLFGLAMTALFLLAACGGGGSTESSPSGNTVMSGNVVNGPLAGATVEFFNTDGQSVGTTTTDSNGFYEHSGLQQSANGYRVVASNGFLNGVPYPGDLIARCEAPPCGVTPLTTAVEKLAEQEQIEYAEAYDQLFDWLGLEEDPFVAAHQNRPVPGVDLNSVRAGLRENPAGVTGWVAQLVEEVSRGGTPPENLRPVTDADPAPAPAPGPEPGPAPDPAPDPVPPPDPDPAPTPGPAPDPGQPEPTEYLVSTNDGSGGSVTPANSTVVEGSTTSFTVTPETGYSIDGVTGCGGTLAGSTYTTGAITGDCTVTVSFALNSYTVTFQDYDGTELKVESVNHGSGATAPSSPSRTGYSFSGWSPAYSNITGDLTVTAQYTINSYIVTPQAGAGGGISPATAQSVNHGEATSFTVTPNSGYAIDQVSGCGGSLSGNTYTTGAISGACTVTASFVPPNLAVPVDVVASASYELGQGEITISWSAVEYATGYRVYWGQSSGNHPDSAPVSDTSHHLTGLTPDQTYYLVVAATAPGVTGPTSDEVFATPTIPAITQGRLNDTGIDWWANGDTNNLTATQPDFPGQDADFGRDAEARAGTLAKLGGGAAGFDFTKLDAGGNDLSVGASDWSCVRDNRTGLIWEVKTTDGGLRDHNNTYTWYNSDSATNGGNAGTQNGGSCSGSNCDTQAFVQAVNAVGLCGASDWRMPTRQELLSIVDNSRFAPSIDLDYFPNTSSAWFWSSSPYAGSAGYAWYVNFSYGSVYYGYGKVSGNGVRLVRAGQ